ncbi:flagellar hook-length control protein FliK, partial [Candidatus Desantisbacteria bacterium]|nr:flagellar hook-length control protein FliK [Candidatus Desantisbacteria bacterium]
NAAGTEKTSKTEEPKFVMSGEYILKNNSASNEEDNLVIEEKKTKEGVFEVKTESVTETDKLEIAFYGNKKVSDQQILGKQSAISKLSEIEELPLEDLKLQIKENFNNEKMEQGIANITGQDKTIEGNFLTTEIKLSEELDSCNRNEKNNSNSKTSGAKTASLEKAKISKNDRTINSINKEHAFFDSEINFTYDKAISSNPQEIFKVVSSSENKELILPQIAEQIKAAQFLRHSEVSFELEPVSLGRINLKLIMDNKNLSAKVIVSNPEVKEIIENNMMQLKNALGQHSIVLDKINVQIDKGYQVNNIHNLEKRDLNNNSNSNTENKKYENNTYKQNEFLKKHRKDEFDYMDLWT